MPELPKVSKTRDRKGRAHYVVHQVYGTSCVPCCIAMVKHYWIGLGGQPKWNEEEEALAASPWKDGMGMSVGDVPKVLHNMIPNIEALHMRPGVKRLWDTLRLWVTPDTPAIVELDHSWRTMGHAALCRFVDNDGFGVFLDPAAGLIETHKSSMPRFRFDEAGKFLFSGALVVCRKKSTP